MSDWLAAVSLLPPIGAVLLLTRSMLYGQSLATRLEWLALSAAFALGFTSVMFFGWRALGGEVGMYAAVETVVIVLLVVVLVYRWATKRRPGILTTTGLAEPIGLRLAAAVLAGATLVAASLAVIARIDAIPHGEWDAWAIWNLRAAFLAAPSAAWLDGFTTAIAWSHPDYPLLLPASVARLWSFAGFESIAAPVIFEAVVLLALVLLTAGTLMASSGYVAAALALSLLLVPEFLLQATAQGADVAMSLFVLLSLALLAQPATVARLVMAGAAAGFAAWTKNEGLVAAIAIVFAFGVVVTTREGLGATIARGKWLIVGLFPVAVVVAVFSTIYAPPKDLMTGIAAAGPLTKLADLERHQQVAFYMFSYLGQWGRWTPVGPIWFVAAWSVAAVFRYRRVPDVVLVAWVTLVGMLAAYYLVYVLTPYDLMWHMQTSWPRLIAQVWPALVWSAAAGAFATSRSSSSLHPQAARR